MPKIIEPNLSPSPTLSYILGVITGDGYVFTEKHGGKYPYKTYGVGLKTVSKSFPESFALALSKIGINPSLREVKPSKSCYTTKNIFVVRAYSVTFFKWFNSLSLEDIETKYLINDEYKKEFVRGFYESEGNLKPIERWSKDGWYIQIRIFNSEKDVLEMVNRLLLSLGYHFNLTKDSDKIGAKYTSNWYGNLNNGKQEEVWRFLKFINPSTKRIEDYDWRDKIK